MGCSCLGGDHRPSGALLAPGSLPASRGAGTGTAANAYVREDGQDAAVVVLARRRPNLPKTR